MLDPTQEDVKELITDLEVAVNQVLVMALHAHHFIYLEL